jgi:hypothetical protein
MQTKTEGQTMGIRINMEGQNRKKLQKQFREFFNGADTEQEYNKRINEFEDMYTPKKEVLQKSKKEFYGVLDAYIQGTLTKEKALLLLQSKRQQLIEEITYMATEGCFIKIDYGYGNDPVPEEFVKIVDKVDYYYYITEDNIENADIKKLENFSSPAVKRIVKSVGASFDKYNGITEKKESRPEQEATQPLQNAEPKAPEPETAENLPSNEVLEKLVEGDSSVLRKWTGGKYKCRNLRQFINEYADIKKENPTKNLILDYLIRENGKQFTEKTIISTLNSYGVSTERKKTKDRRRNGTHK